MEWVIVILFIVIGLLVSYLFYIKKELKRMIREIQNTEIFDSNHLLHLEISSKELYQLTKEINHILKKIREEKIQFERKNIALKKMMTNISHDLRTPLTSALGYIDLVLISEFPQEEKKELMIIQERLKRLEELIYSFFMLSQVVSYGQEVEFQKVNIVSIIEECIAHYYEDYHKENRTIFFTNHISEGKRLSNTELLMRIFDNLIGNAYKHSTGNLDIVAYDNQIIFSNSLTDSKLDIGHIFDEFYTVDISRTKGNTGLGLAIVKEFTEILGGNIKAEKIGKTLNIILEFSKKK